MDRQINIVNFGELSLGLSDKEINTYLKERYNSYAEYFGLKLITNKQLKSLRKIFSKIAGINTQGVIFINGKQIIFMYRHNVKRFSDMLFVGNLTYWD